MSTTQDPLRWSGHGCPSVDPAGIHQALAQVEQPGFIVSTARGIGAVAGGTAGPGGNGPAVLAAVPALPPQRLGSAEFRSAHGVRQSYMAGAMAGGIASADLVIALARQGFLASFGAAGLLPETIAKVLGRFATEIPGLPYAVNLIHSPSEERLEREAVELFLRHGVRCVEASAYLGLTAHLVRYRLAGLRRDPSGRVVAEHRVIAKVSRAETAERFMRPAPAALVDTLLREGLVTPEQAQLAHHVPLADDITVEADSGGHTDRRPLPALFPVILRVRDHIQREHRYATPIRVGAAGGLGTPAAVAAAFTMGAAYVVTGSVNQSCLESGTSPAARALLAQAEVTDCVMAPAADMFEMGVELQVLRRGSMFGMRAQQLYRLYQAYDGLEALPAEERARLESQLFRRPLEAIWQECVAYFSRRDPDQLARAADNPKRRMALVFRWYLGMASRWAVTGEADRTADYQIWCGPSMGSFNAWVAGSYLSSPENRTVADVAHHLMRGAAFHTRLAQLATAGVTIPSAAADYQPVPLELPALTEAAR
ncbi:MULTISPECIES: PfaD family polyunsaturated fatty acid/polyketide biosynthesis protein [unclassified Streptomyces]|uniref:PfaD family polyunsaturated fatty acid/polyketide biosynthesis protein n=1 Tax=unclassified Streptomyces TaxID=2593676 RepID=UPI00225BF050|nr:MULTISPECIES: PfaD family polyunsaturated fatty acid/polyketide biosynthesis protein [unclassified Streptomyces]MCX5063059.1 PfaD family polyunsaturated fatty acid/polyketide biosynthesis protein [Streptomyces sp. NBC_00452]